MDEEELNLNWPPSGGTQDGENETDSPPAEEEIIVAWPPRDNRAIIDQDKRNGEGEGPAQGEAPGEYIDTPVSEYSWNKIFQLIIEIMKTIIEVFLG